ncbi:uncharacterized protein LOC121876853 [Homarus americanus]|uniref:uncharacterized protein LOC121876853 n=1 Tax=Homarus americanus TaxID=6706 RepID=UPI001C44D2B5|nr:uncharacterized protein LOC121876853 [Homarus americanus]
MAAAWRTKSVPYDDVNLDVSPQTEDGSLLQLLRTKSLPLLGGEGGRATRPLSLPTPHKSGLRSVLIRGTSTSTLPLVTSKSINPRLSECSDSTAASVTSLTSTPDDPSSADQRKLTRSVSDGYLWTRRKKQLRDVRDEFPAGTLPSVKNLKNKFDQSHETDSKTADRWVSHMASPPGDTNMDDPLSTPGSNTATKRKRLSRHESLVKWEGRSMEESMIKMHNITRQSVKILLQHFENTQQPEAGGAAPASDDTPCEDTSRPPLGLPPKPVEITEKQPQGKSTQHTKSPAATSRPQTKGDVGLSPNQSLHTSLSVRKLKTEFERKTKAGSTTAPISTVLVDTAHASTVLVDTAHASTVLVDIAPASTVLVDTIPAGTVPAGKVPASTALASTQKACGRQLTKAHNTQPQVTDPDNVPKEVIKQDCSQQQHPQPLTINTRDERPAQPYPEVTVHPKGVPSVNKLRKKFEETLSSQSHKRSGGGDGQVKQERTAIKTLLRNRFEGSADTQTPETQPRGRSHSSAATQVRSFSYGKNDPDKIGEEDTRPRTKTLSLGLMMGRRRSSVDNLTSCDGDSRPEERDDTAQHLINDHQEKTMDSRGQKRSMKMRYTEKDEEKRKQEEGKKKRDKENEQVDKRRQELQQVEQKHREKERTEGEQREKYREQEPMKREQERREREEQLRRRQIEEQERLERREGRRQQHDLKTTQEVKREHEKKDKEGSRKEEGREGNRKEEGRREEINVKTHQSLLRGRSVLKTGSLRVKLASRHGHESAEGRGRSATVPSKSLSSQRDTTDGKHHPIDDHNVGEASGVATLVDKFTHSNKLHKKDCESLSPVPEGCVKGSSTEAKTEEDTAQVLTTSTKNHPGNVRTLREGELLFFKMGNTGEAFVRSQSMREKKKLPPPFARLRGGSMRGNQTEPKSSTPLPHNCRHLHPDELRFFTPGNNNIYTA